MGDLPDLAKKIEHWVKTNVLDPAHIARAVVELRARLAEAIAERDQLKSQLEAMRKSRDDLAQALELVRP